LDAARSDVEGAGIGLALSKWLVDLMQGAIGVKSAPGAGSTFWVALARAQPGEVPLAAERQAAAPNALREAKRQYTVLYIEDNEVNQLLMQGMLAQRPTLRLLLAAHPEDGLALAWSERPDLVLLDIQLPGMDGFEVLRRLRADPRTRQVPVLAVSANAMPADRERAAQAGFAHYVTKPIDLPRLLTLLDGLLPG
jgi:CheY-like chemotaxis protein